MWLITVFVFIVLAITTIGLVAKASSQANSGISGYIKSSNPTIYLQTKPNATSQIVTILNLDTKVLVTDTATEKDQTWLYVETGTYAGWVPADIVSVESP